MQDKHISFALEEYKALRVEIDNLQKRSYAMETAVVLGVSAFIAFSMKPDGTKITGIYWWLPLFLVLIVICKEIAIRSRLLKIGEYIRNIESHMSFAKICGWEHHLASLRKTSQGRLIGYSNILFWLFMCIFCFLLGYTNGFSR